MNYIREAAALMPEGVTMEVTRNGVILRNNKEYTEYRKFFRWDELEPSRVNVIANWLEYCG